MRIRRRVALVVGVVALGVLSVVPSSPPVSANPGYVQLNIGAMSPQYMEDGCRYKILYGNFGSAPFAWARLYGGCSNVNLGVRSLNGSTETWTWGTTVVGSGTDGCGSYSLVQTNGPNPAYATGASIIGNGSFWLAYDYDGDQTQPIHSTC